MTIPCRFCNEPIDPTASFNWQRITGWEKKAAAASRKGGSDIALRERLEEFACGHCIARLKRGVAPSQEAML